MLFLHFFHPKEDHEKEAVNKIMKDLDMNNDEKLDFQEFMALVVRLIHSIHEAFGGSFSHRPI